MSTKVKSGAKAAKESTAVKAAHKFAAVVVEQRAAELAARAASERVHQHQIVAWSNGLTGCEPVTTAIWNAEWKETVKADLLAKPELYDAKSVGIVLNRQQQFVIARTNGMEPEAGESVETYLKRVGPTIKSKGLYVPANGGGNPVNKAKAEAIKDDKGQVVDRALALLVVSNNDKADAQMIDFLTSRHMDKLRALYTTLSK